MNIYEKIVAGQEKLAVVGLGYVGLPIAIAFSKKVQTIGFDVNQAKINDFKQGIEPTSLIGDEAIRECSVEFTADEEKLAEAAFFIIAVPTPLQADKVPDLQYLKSASRLVGRRMKRGSIVVFESTVYPGVTEDYCLPLLEAESGLQCGKDFSIGYSPERINPGDQDHRLENIVKIVSGMDESTLGIIANLYELVIEAGVYRAENIKVAEAAKVIENAQRDINIAFMNELSMLFHKMDIDTQSVLRAAGTKWNFMKFSPGLVGGHCIGIDPYYLTYKAEGTGYHSKIILAGRHINDGMGKYVAQELIKVMVKLKKDITDLKVGILGLTYKEDCPDTRNSKVIDIIDELAEYGVATLVADPVADKEEVYREYGINLADITELSNLNVVVVAVPHRQFSQLQLVDFNKMYSNGDSKAKVIIDVKGSFNRFDFENNGYYYWCL